MNEIIAGISAPLINIIVLVAIAGGVFSLVDQFNKFKAHQAERTAKKRELQAEFAAFLKARGKTRPATPNTVAQMVRK